VNPFGVGTKKVTIKLVCVEYIPTAVGLKWIAHFRYENKNTKPVYVPTGPDNKLYGLCSFNGSTPNLFNPGVGNFTVKFDGLLLIWILKTNENSSQAIEFAYATFLNERCTNNLLTGNQRLPGTISNEETAAVPQVNTAEQGKIKTGLYPNPAGNRISVQMNNSNVSDKDITISDVNGRNYSVRIVSRGAGSLELNISGLKKGVYFIRMNEAGTYKTLSFVKL
jgi:hypothetical protein